LLHLFQSTLPSKRRVRQSGSRHLTLVSVPEEAGNPREMRAMFAFYSLLLMGGIVLFALVGLTSG